MGIFDTSYEENFIEGEDFYINKNGYRVMTESYLVRRGYCCSNGCRHCPYFPRAQKGNRVLHPDVAKKYKN